MAEQHKTSFSPVFAARFLAGGSGWYGVYLFLSLVLFFPSLTFWFSGRFDIITNEFDYFIGQYPSFLSENPSQRLMLGKLFFAFVYILAGMSYWKWVRSSAVEALSWKKILLLATPLCALYLASVPWISPDVFYYLRGGWIEAGYGQNPFLTAAVELPGYKSDEMFNNTFPSFLAFKGNYGPFFQWFCYWVTKFSGGEIKVALILFKLLCLIAHVVCTLLVVKLVAAQERRASAIALAYSCNPLLLFTFLACTHNDGLMMMFVGISIWLMVMNRVGMAAVFLAGAFCIKFIPLLLIPAFFLYVMKNNEGIVAKLKAWGCFTGLFLFSSGLLYLSYPGSWEVFTKLSTEGLTALRSCSVIFFYPTLHLLTGLSLTRFSQGALLLFFLISGWILFRRFWQKEKMGSVEFQVLIMKIFLLYLMIVSTTVTEWYWAWILPFCFLFSPRVQGRMLFAISVLFMAMTIFVIRSYPALEYVMQHFQYMLLLYVGVLTFFPKITERSSHSTDYSSAPVLQK
jgi:alpha-1,6-mannosyltransferase